MYIFKTYRFLYKAMLTFFLSNILCLEQFTKYGVRQLDMSEAVNSLRIHNGQCYHKSSIPLVQISVYL